LQILIVKTSSLGDIVHTLPALTDALRAIPGLQCDWLVEQAFAEIPRWHAGVRRTIACDLRGWRRAPWHSAFGGPWRDFRRALRAQRYDRVIDAQGLLKSAWLAWQARGPLAGPDRASAREPLAACFYRERLAVPRHDAAHAVERARRLFALALGYALPDSAPDAGLDRARFPRPDLAQPYVVLLHGTTWDSKRWPPASWMQIAQWLAGRGLRVVLPWGTAAEHAQAKAIAGACACAGLVLPRLGLGGLAGWLAHARPASGWIRAWRTWPRRWARPRSACTGPPCRN